MRILLLPLLQRRILTVSTLRNENVVYVAGSLTEGPKCR